VNRLLEIFGARSPIASVVAVLFFVAPLAAGAQPAGKVHRIGFLGNSTAALKAHLVGPFREGLRELGYVEGQNIVIEYRWAEGKYERSSMSRAARQRVAAVETEKVASQCGPGREPPALPVGRPRNSLDETRA
jgi:hypothetical protein